MNVINIVIIRPSNITAEEINASVTAERMIGFILVRSLIIDVNSS